MDFPTDHTLNAVQQTNAKLAALKPVQLQRIHIALFGALIGTLLACAALALAAESDRSEPRVAGKMVAKFNSADKDGDGTLNREEAEAGGWKPVVKHFDRLDADRDGKVTREEIRSILRSRMSRMQ